VGPYDLMELKWQQKSRR